MIRISFWFMVGLVASAAFSVAYVLRKIRVPDMGSVEINRARRYEMVDRSRSGEWPNG